MPLRKILIVIIVGAVFNFLSQVSSTILMLRSEYLQRNPVIFLVTLADLLSPIALIIFAAALLNRKNAKALDEL